MRHTIFAVRAGSAWISMRYQSFASGSVDDDGPPPVRVNRAGPTERNSEKLPVVPTRNDRNVIAVVQLGNRTIMRIDQAPV